MELVLPSTDNDDKTNQDKPEGVCISTDTVYQKAFYADKKIYSVLLKAEFDINGTNSLRAGRRALFPLMHAEK